MAFCGVRMPLPVLMERTQLLLLTLMPSFYRQAPSPVRLIQFCRLAREAACSPRAPKPALAFNAWHKATISLPSNQLVWSSMPSLITKEYRE